MPDYFTGRGDDGTTGLLGEGRVPKYHARPEAYGAVDEASAALGLARSLAISPETREIVLEVQRDLYRLMGELAAEPDAAVHLTPLEPDRVTWLEQQIERVGSGLDKPRDFIVPGDCPSAAAMDLARTAVRRAERRVARLVHEGSVKNLELLRYLNRSSSLCFVLELWEIHQAGAKGPTLAKRAAE